MPNQNAVDKEHAVYLPQDEMPTHWYNILADLPEPLLRLFAKELVMQEVSAERFIKIPDEAYGTYMRLPRPTPLLRAKRLKKHLNTTAQIYYKCEYDSGLL